MVLNRNLADGSRSTSRSAGFGNPIAPPAPPASIARPATHSVGAGKTFQRSSGGGGGVSYGGGGTGGGTGGGGGGGGFVSPMAVAAPVAPPMSEADFLNSDDVYLAALSRYNKTYDDLLADVTRRQGDYDTTFNNSLDDLGWRPGQGGAPGNWDFQDQQSAAGRGYQSLIQDFAARGLLHSGDYVGAQNDFVSQLGRQLDSMNTAKQQFGEGLNQERTTGMTSRDAGIGQARAEALARMAQIYGAV